jgi:hypothetical protein
MKAKLGFLLLGAGFVIPAFSHHSFDAEYDRTKTVVFKGVVTKVEWMNPHSRVYIDVTDENGNVTNWNMELGSPNSLTRAGWKRDALKVGDKVIISASLAKDGSKMANARLITLEDGRRVLSGASSADNN